MRFIVHVGISLHHHLGGKQQNVVHVSVMYHVGICLICKLAGECKCEFSLQSLVILEEYSGQNKISSIHVYDVINRK